MKYARIADELVAELVEIDGDPAEQFHPALVFIPAPPACTVGWRLVNGDLVSPPPDLETGRAQKRAAIDAAYVASVERGLSWGEGDAIQIGDEYRQNIGALASKAGFVIAGTPGFTWPEGGMPYRTRSNAWHGFGTVELVTMAQQVGDLYLAIRQRYAALKDAVAAADTVEAIATVDPAAGWPN